MNWKSALAIYFLFWGLSIFFVLPFGIRTSREAGDELVPGQAESAPHEFNFWRVALRTTIVSAALFALFMLNWNFEWLTMDQLDNWIHGPR